jgi:hypothetical protein
MVCRVRRLRVGDACIDSAAQWQRLVFRWHVRCSCDAGAFRVANGSDLLIFYGPTEHLEGRRPRLDMVVRGPGPSMSPTPAPYPYSDVGTITAGNTSSVEVSCDGGASWATSAADADVCVCVSVCVKIFQSHIDAMRCDAMRCRPWWHV